MRCTDGRRGQAALVELEVPSFRTDAGVSIVRFAGFDREGRFQVEGGAAGEPVVALSTIGLEAADVGTRVVVAYEGGDARSPVIIGRVHDRAGSAPSARGAERERVVIRAERDIELRCGEASIVLTRAGKVLIRGSYVLSRSRGANKIKGAFVDIN